MLLCQYSQAFSPFCHLFYATMGFIVGLPRTGTSLLHTLLALDPLSRYLRNFETVAPMCPPPELMSGEVDPRVQTFHDTMTPFFDRAPNLRGINGLNFMATGPTECLALTALDLVHMGWSVGSSLFTYGNWIANCDMTPAYQWHKRVLQLLQWKLPNERWVLKSPLHLFGLEQLLDTYPDASVVFTHRDPVAAVTSGISMTCQWTAFSSGQVNAAAIADWYPALWAGGLERAMVSRDILGDHQCFDVYHKDLTQDPIKAVGAIYDHFELPFSGAAKKRMQVWIRDNPRSRFGGHTYSAKEYGIQPEQLRKRFEFYLADFDF